MEFKDYYAILGIPRTASQAEIRKAFRRLAREWHPDRRPGDKEAEQRFKDINEAHEVLSDPEKRRRYDALGANWEAFRGAGADPFADEGPFAGFRAGGPGRIRVEFRQAGPGDFSEFFRTFFGGDVGHTGSGAGREGRTSFDDILAEMGLGELFGRGGAGRSGAATPLEVEAELSLEEAFHGTTRTVAVNGRRLQVEIPKGVDTGSRVRLTGQGGGGRDLVVVIKVRPHPVFTRRGADLERELPITLREALLGGEVPVSTLKSRVLLTIPPGTQNGTTFRLTGQGMPRLNGPGSGDLYVRVRVVMPSNLSPEAQAAARRFLDLVGQPDPRAAP